MSCLRRLREVGPLMIEKSRPWVFFDGAFQQQVMGLGFLIYISNVHKIQFKANLGARSNN